MAYQLEDIERHWKNNQAILQTGFQDWMAIFKELVPVATEVAASLEGRRSLAENCTYLLISKGINHSLATYTLISKGLLIDASLTARNAVETFLMLELFATDPTEVYFKEWADGKEFKPAWVRSKLGSFLSATVREVVITCDDDFYETIRMAYSFWSGITHSNLKSAQYSVRALPDGSLEVPTGGGLRGQNALVNCLFAVTCSGLLRSILIASAVFSVKLLQDVGSRLAVIQARINAALKTHDMSKNEQRPGT